MAVLTDDEREYLDKRLHSPDMQCEQCRLVRLLLAEDTYDAGLTPKQRIQQAETKAGLW